MKALLKNLFDKFGYSISKKTDLNQYEEIYSRYKSFTMIPADIYVQNLKLVSKFVQNIEGDVVECGVWRGGMSAGIASLLGNNREYHLFDSFEGLPEAKEIDGQSALQWQNNPEGYNYYDNCKAEIDFAQKAMATTGSSYFIHKGWFSETLPVFKSERPIALLRLDGDWYDSTMECLVHLYDKVKTGGLIIMDDYYTWDGCSKAVHDYLSSIKSSSRLYHTSNEVSYIIKRD